MSKSSGNAMNASAVVLLSGGMDSIAALHWSLGRFDAIRAISFDYAQPNRDAEIAAAQTEAARLSIPWERVYAGSIFPRAGLLAGVTDHVEKEGAVTNAAFVPARNLLFLTIAAGFASAAYRIGNLAVVIGACKDDALGFPDCRAGTLAKQGEALRAGLAREVSVIAPWIDRTKTQILESLDEAGRAAVARSWSCYRAEGPCGACTACVTRGRAFAEYGLVDEAKAPVMHGGDPSRERR